MDGDVLAQIAELARQKQSLGGGKSVRHAFPAVCTLGEVALLRTPMTVSDGDNGLGFAVFRQTARRHDLAGRIFRLTRPQNGSKSNLS